MRMEGVTEIVVIAGGATIEDGIEVAAFARCAAA